MFLIACRMRLPSLEGLYSGGFIDDMDDMAEDVLMGVFFHT
jgi:hypothetical protein